MLRFRPEKQDAVPPGSPPPPKASVQFVPMSADDFRRRQRRKVAVWVGSLLSAAVVILFVLYRSTLPSEALNRYLDAKKLFENGKYPEALEAVNSATSDKGRRLDAFTLRAAIFRSMHRPQDAVADLTRVIDLQPRVAENYRTRAQLYSELGQTDQALQDYTRLIELENSASAYDGRGVCYLLLKQPQRAVEDFSKAVEREPSVESYMQRGLAYATMGEHRKAIDDLDRAIELRPEVSATYRARAASRQQLGDRAGAEQDREKAFSLEKPVQRAPSQVLIPEA